MALLHIQVCFIPPHIKHNVPRKAIPESSQSGFHTTRYRGTVSRAG